MEPEPAQASRHGSKIVFIIFGLFLIALILIGFNPSLNPYSDQSLTKKSVREKEMADHNRDVQFSKCDLDFKKSNPFSSSLSIQAGLFSESCMKAAGYVPIPDCVDVQKQVPGPLPQIPSCWETFQISKHKP